MTRWKRREWNGKGGRPSCKAPWSGACSAALLPGSGIVSRSSPAARHRGSIQFAVEGGDFFPALVARVPGQGFCQVHRAVLAAGAAEGDGHVTAGLAAQARQPGVQEAADLADVLGDREAAVARELTKKFEEVTRGTLTELAKKFSKKVLGEIVIIVSGKDRKRLFS